MIRQMCTYKCKCYHALDHPVTEVHMQRQADNGVMLNTRGNKVIREMLPKLKD